MFFLIFIIGFIVTVIFILGFILLVILGFITSKTLKALVLVFRQALSHFPFYIIFTLFLNFNQLPLCINWFCICAGQEGEDARGRPWLLLAVLFLQRACSGPSQLDIKEACGVTIPRYVRLCGHQRFRVSYHCLFALGFALQIPLFMTCFIVYLHWVSLYKAHDSIPCFSNFVNLIMF